jgi:hypothetical protein
MKWEHKVEFFVLARFSCPSRLMCRSPFSRLAPLNLHVVGELEVTFEVPRGDALVEHVAALLLVVEVRASAG